MLRKIALIAAALPLLYLGLMMGASEFAEEVVELRTSDESGSHPTSLWIVEDRSGNLWMRAGMSDSGWVERIRANPDAELVRGGTTSLRTAVLFPKRRDQVHAMMAERYGWSDKIISAMRDGSGSIAVRLDER